ncbi:MAG: hypothetical protein OXU45_02975 [Candidatus Melainabacteria bacterium]|nr:hypothetical protein [Candidatus Melainabacteria bacterium]
MLAATTGGQSNLLDLLKRRLGARKPRQPSKPSIWARLGSAVISGLRAIAKPLLYVSPLLSVLSLSHRHNERDEIKEIDTRLSETQSQEELMEQHQQLQDEAEFEFHASKSDSPRPLAIVAYGSTQDLRRRQSGLRRVVDELQVKHDVNVLLLKAPHAYKELKHYFKLSDDAGGNTGVRSHLNKELIRDVLEGKGMFSNVKTDSVCTIGYSWGGGMLSKFRKDGFFEELGVEIAGTVTVDPIKTGLLNMGAPLPNLACGDEPNLHFYQNMASYGLNGSEAVTLDREDDESHCVPDMCHCDIDHDPWVHAKIFQFLDKLFRDSKIADEA